jgi:hypothetical protein
MGCAWLADLLTDAGYRAEDDATSALIERWRGVPAGAIETGNSVGYLRRTGQLRDFDFTVAHVDDLELVCAIEGNELCAVGPT